MKRGRKLSAEVVVVVDAVAVAAVTAADAAAMVVAVVDAVATAAVAVAVEIVETAVIVGKLSFKILERRPYPSGRRC